MPKMRIYKILLPVLHVVVERDFYFLEKNVNCQFLEQNEENI